MKRCPYCAEEIQDAAVLCRYCQRDLRTGQTPTATTAMPRVVKVRQADFVSTIAKWAVGILIALFVLYMLSLLFVSY